MMKNAANYFKSKPLLKITLPNPEPNYILIDSKINPSPSPNPIMTTPTKGIPSSKKKDSPIPGKSINPQINPKELILAFRPL